MSDELKPCPWCNGEAYAFPVLDRNGEHDGFSVLCLGCDASIETYASNEKAIFAWNTRPIEDALRAENEELRAKWDAAHTYTCQRCLGTGTVRTRCIDNPDVHSDCPTCNGWGVLYARPKEAAE